MVEPATGDVTAPPVAEIPTLRLRTVGAVVLAASTIAARALQMAEHMLPGVYGATAAATHHTLDWLASSGLHTSFASPAALAAFETAAPVDTTALPEITIPAGANWGQVLNEFGLTPAQATAFMEAHGAELHDRGLAYGSPGDWRINMGTPVHGANGVHGVMAAADAEWIQNTAQHDGYLAASQPDISGEPMQPPHITPTQATPPRSLETTLQPASSTANTALPLVAPAPVPAETGSSVPGEASMSGDEALADAALSLTFTAGTLWVLARRFTRGHTASHATSPIKRSTQSGQPAPWTRAWWREAGTNTWWRSLKRN